MGDTEPREADTAPDTRRTHLKIELSTPIKIELSTPTVSCLGNDGRQTNWETNPPKADTAPDTGPGRQMNWETNELGNQSPGGGHSPCHRTWETNELGDKDLGDKWIGRQMNWETNRPEADTAPDTRRTNELGDKSPGGGHSPWHRTWETNELGDKWIGRQIPRRRTQPLTQDLGDKWIGRQMNWKTNRPEADIVPDTRRTHFKIELSTPTVNCLGKNPGRSLVGICYIEAVGKGLRTYRFRRPSPGVVVYPEIGLIPARAPPLTSSGSSRQCYHLLPLQPEHSADQNGMLGDAGAGMLQTFMIDLIYPIYHI